MKYLIDTNILIYYFNGSLSASAKEKITAMLTDDFNNSHHPKHPIEFAICEKLIYTEKGQDKRTKK